MATVTAKPKSFRSRAAGAATARVCVPIPFDPAKVWGERDRFHVAGLINGMRIRGVVERGGDGWLFALGPAWRRDHGLNPGDPVEMTLAIEGPQRDDLAPDLAKALAAEPEAARFWDGIAQFYRKGYLRWVDGTKRRPEERARRIAELIRLLKAGRKQW